MKRYARVEGGEVREIIERPDAFDMSRAYHPSLVWVDITGLTPAPEEGWLYDGAIFTAPPPPPPPPSDPEIADAEIAGSRAWTGLARLLVDLPGQPFGNTEAGVIASLKAKLP